MTTKKTEHIIAYKLVVDHSEVIETASLVKDSEEIQSTEQTGSLTGETKTGNGKGTRKSTTQVNTQTDLM